MLYLILNKNKGLHQLEGLIDGTDLYQSVWSFDAYDKIFMGKIHNFNPTGLARTAEKDVPGPCPG